MASSEEHQSNKSERQNGAELKPSHYAHTQIGAIWLVPFRRIIFTRAYAFIMVFLPLDCFLDSPRPERKAPVETPV